jgi:very-short-patch-repair endonuclease
MYRSRVKPCKFRYAAGMRKAPTQTERLLRSELNRISLATSFRWQFQTIVFGYILDFYCAKVRVAVEVDGSSHDGRERHDENRDAVLRSRLGIITLRFTNEEVLADVAGVGNKVMRFCAQSPVYKTWNSGRGKKK